MQVYFLRHGIAVDPEAWSGSDFDRPLTREGCDRMEREAKAIDELSLDLDCIVTSPLLRAKQTASIIAARLGMRSVIVEDPRLAGGFNLERLRAILTAHPGVSALMLVGHEPSMSETIGHAIGAASIELKKAALAGIEISSPSAPRGMLLFLIPPKVLVALGKR
ncbi:MAG TPA: histidine phosphatase family protein [Candidatus Cybelea sp.]|jgi:phosphohistidine phosphatase|nr:histidine phosphatase family protein [Candidatus Cybelea sp.]